MNSTKTGLAIIIIMLALALTVAAGCSVEIRDSDMVCLRAHDEVRPEIDNNPVKVCDEYSPGPSTTGQK